MQEHYFFVQEIPLVDNTGEEIYCVVGAVDLGLLTKDESQKVYEVAEKAVPYDFWRNCGEISIQTEAEATMETKIEAQKYENGIFGTPSIKSSLDQAKFAAQVIRKSRTSCNDEANNSTRNQQKQLGKSTHINSLVMKTGENIVFTEEVRQAESNPPKDPKKKRWTKKTANTVLIPAMCGNPNLSIRQLNKITGIPYSTIQGTPAWEVYKRIKAKGIEVTRDVFEVLPDMAASPRDEEAERQESLDQLIKNQKRDMYADENKISQKQV